MIVHSYLQYLQLHIEKNIIQILHNKLMLKNEISLKYISNIVLYQMSLHHFKLIFFIKLSLKVNRYINNQRKDHTPLKTSYNKS